MDWTKLGETIIKENDKINSKSSVDLYLSKVKKIAKDFGAADNKNLKFLDDTEKVMKTFEDKSISTQKNYLWSIYTILKYGGGDEKLIEKYLGLFNKVADKVQEEKNNGLKSKKQEENWVELTELHKILKTHEKQYKLGIKGDKISNEGMKHLRMFLAGNLYIGDPENPPRRLQDYAKMHIVSKKEYDTLTDKEKSTENYLIQNKNKKQFSFGNYKTDAKYGTMKIDVGKKLSSVINRYLKYHKGKFLLETRTGKHLTSLELGSLLNEVFRRSGKKISVSMLRHIFISENFGEVAKKQKETASKMGHSVGTAINEYAVE